MIRLAWLWPAQAFLDDLILIYPVYAIMMQEAGVSAVELSGLFIAWSLAALLFEIPSGVLGDRVNRKLYIGCGALVSGSGYLVWLFWPSLPGFALGFVLWSLGGAIRSGTLEALLYDCLKAQGQTAQFSRYYGRGVAASGAGVVVAMALGGIAASEGFTLPLVLSALAPAGSALLIFSMPSPGSGSQTAMGEAEPDALHPEALGTEELPREAGGLFTTLRSALDDMRGAAGGERHLLRIAAMGVFLVGVPQVLDEYVGLLLDETGTLTLAGVGVLYGISAGAFALGGGLGHWFDGFSLRRLAMVGGAAHILLAAVLTGSPYVMTPALTVYFFVLGALSVALTSALQHAITSAARATVMSLMTAGLEAWGVMLYLLIGVLAEWLDWRSAVAWVGLMSVLIGAAFASRPLLENPNR